MYISVGDKLYISGMPLAEANKLVEHYKIPNPAFAAIKRFSKYGTRYTKVPKFLYGGCVNDRGQVVLPRCVTIPDNPEFDEVCNTPVDDRRVYLDSIKFPEPVLKLNTMQEKLSQVFKSRQVTPIQDTPPGFLAVAGTSFGKTIALLDLARLTEQPTLILIHRSLIKEVWINDIIKYFDGKADMGLIQNQPHRWTIGKHFTVAMEQTLNTHPEAMKSLFPLFGTVIQDECHICPMPFIQGILNSFPAMYRLGGTATPTRPHRMHEFLYWILGKPFFSTTDTSLVAGNQMSIDEVIFVKTKFRYTPEKSEVFDSHELTDKLIFNQPRNEQIISGIMQDQAEGHCVLVASTRREHCNLLYDILIARGIKPLLVLGGAQSANKADLADLMQSPKGRVVLATEQLIREGANVPPFDRLHIVVPLGSRGNTLQLCGRICRKHPNKTDAKVIVYFDMGCPALRRRVANPMMQAFKELKIPSVDKVWFL